MDKYKSTRALGEGTLAMAPVAPEHPRLSKAESRIDRDGDGIITREEVLEGVYPSKPAKVRILGAVVGTTVQHVLPKQKEIEELNAHEQNNGGESFSVRFQTWRRVNMRMAALAVVLRFVLTATQAWVDISKQVERASPDYRNCKVALIMELCGCADPNYRDAYCLDVPTASYDRCELDASGELMTSSSARLPSKITPEELRMITEGGFCPPAYGVKATSAFPLLPDHILESMATFYMLVIFKLCVRFVAELLAIVFIELANYHWASYTKSRRFVRVAFGLSILPAFALALFVPMRAGVNTSKLRDLVCHDVKSHLVQPDGSWLMGMNLPPPNEFCALPPETWGNVVVDAIQDSGLTGEFNTTIGSFTCPKAIGRREECRRECSGCFGDIERTENKSGRVVTFAEGRNPCLDYLTFDRICRGRDEIAETQLRARLGDEIVDQLWGSTYSYEGSASEDGRRRLQRTLMDDGYDSITKEVISAARLTGGYLEPTSMCNQIEFADCSEACDGTFPTGGSFNGSQSCTDACASTFLAEQLGSIVAGTTLPANLCAGADLTSRALEISNTKDLWEAVEVGVGIVVAVQTVVQVLPPGLSLVLGMLKATKVMKQSLPWVRLPAFQMLLASSLVIPLIVAIMASLFQMAADGYALGFCCFAVAAFVGDAWPTAYFVRPKSYEENKVRRSRFDREPLCQQPTIQLVEHSMLPTRVALAPIASRTSQKEKQKRSMWKYMCFLLCLVFLVLWLSQSPRLRKLLEDSGMAKLISIADEPELLFNSPKVRAAVGRRGGWG